MKKYIAYYRVSTQRQNLGIDAQKATIEKYLENTDSVIINEYQEKESGKNNNRIQLHLAIEECKKEDAILIIAKLDRLSRNISFIFTLRDSKVDFVCCDIPELNTLSLGMFAVIAQNERELISSRTKSALAIKRQKGIKLGAPNPNFSDEIRQKAYIAHHAVAEANKNNQRATLMIISLLGQNKNYSEIARILNSNGFLTARNKQFNPIQVKRLIDRYNKSNSL